MAKMQRNYIELLVDFIKIHPALSSKEIHEGIGIAVAYATIKRALDELISENLIITIGKGKGTKYVISPAYELLRDAA